ncbi:hypothetical protein CHCC14821_2920 [Bacillus paralicheniformis]|nr:hypothetical protein CHCC14821_2920 [Bacillus paralicheniformis]
MFFKRKYFSGNDRSEKRKNRPILFAYKNPSKTGNFIFLPKKTILLTYSFV